MNYKNIQGWFNYDFLFDRIVKQYPKGAFLEVGCWKGKSSNYFANILNKENELYCVDTWLGSSYNSEHNELIDKLNKSLFEEFKSNMNGLKYTAIQKDSITASKDFKDNSLDFIFIDAGHLYEEVKEDIKAWLPKLKKGGTLAGHDYGNSEGVTKAVDEIFKNKKIEKNVWSLKS